MAFEPEKDFSIQWDCIEQVYDGQLDICSCGCGGEYLYTKHYSDLRNRHRDKFFLSSDDERIKGIMQEFEQSDRVKFQKMVGGFVLELKTSDGWNTEQDSSAEIGFRVYFKHSPFTKDNVKD